MVNAMFAFSLDARVTLLLLVKFLVFDPFLDSVVLWIFDPTPVLVSTVSWVYVEDPTVALLKTLVILFASSYC